MFVLCTPNKRICMVGNSTLRSPNGDPLYTADGIVCFSNMKTCTNGFKILRSYKGVEIPAKAVMCINKRTRCVLGDSIIHTNGPQVFVADGIICTDDKKICTNGHSRIISSTPLY